MADIDTMATQWVSHNDDGVLNDLFASLVAGSEIIPNIATRLEDWIRLEQPGKLTDEERGWLAALNRIIVDGTFTTDLGDIRANTVGPALLTTVPRIDANTINTNTLVAGIPGITSDLALTLESALTAETGVGAIITGLAAAKTVIDAINLWTAATTDQIGALDPSSLDLTDLMALVNAIKAKTDQLTTMHGKLTTLLDTFTGTDEPDSNYRLGIHTGNDGIHIATQAFGLNFLSDYLNGILIALPVSGYTELVNAIDLDPVTVIECPRLSGIGITFTDIPASWAHHKGPPYRYEPLGEISYGRLGGFHGIELLRFNPTVIQPFPAGSDHVRIELYGGLHAHYRLIAPLYPGD